MRRVEMMRGGDESRRVELRVELRRAKGEERERKERRGHQGISQRMKGTVKKRGWRGYKYTTQRSKESHRELVNMK
ncbi:hypothetical protein Pmani_026011 [Petrolisthes manimaculis]|uniref:Uncharacterized protein n=1 Tax=Petrolisthes manimaculis TaxID=1843537 RepID=A0AAE1P5L2_9EUCA|nr:hypothetical protein Pmani_026011 [Petrolisthes manimaculis]